ncbi:YicC/YloC family endoribonuclease [Desulfohalovibrio reitneri]|uniref:YicC/YloC family endoribonuclease n=1 Tax=Desulfohalovibrio reitneri TaxID=1307759 RepID=UPI0004A7748F|nr:YicC/YloC family endoribonuclease [Desulfohalovibrio reitneri]
MIRSMTGFGRYEAVADDWTVTWEVKSVNGRFLDAKWRTPTALRGREQAWEKTLREYAARGRVELYLGVRFTRSEAASVSLNRPVAAAMLSELRDLAQDTGAEFIPDLNRLLALPALWQEEASDEDSPLALDADAALREALASWNRSREGEGRATAADLGSRLATLQQLIEQIRQRVGVASEEKFASLRQRVGDLLAEAGADSNGDRMLQEIAILADRLDVSEELNRLDTHLGRFASILERGGEVGKKLDFLVQETFREMNTCGTKSQDAEISRLVVDGKAELEKIREQVQNLE